MDSMNIDNMLYMDTGIVYETWYMLVFMDSMNMDATTVYFVRWMIVDGKNIPLLVILYYPVLVMIIVHDWESRFQLVCIKEWQRV